MRGNCLSYEMFKGVNYGSFFFFYEIGLEVAFGFHYDLPWMAYFPATYLYQPADL